MNIIYNFTGSPLTSVMFKKGIIDVPPFLKEELKILDESVIEGKNTKETAAQMVLGLLKDAAPSGAAVGIVLPDTTPYSEWKLVTATALKVGIDVYIDSEML